MPFGPQEPKRKARAIGIHASNSTLEAIFFRLEEILSAASATRPATEGEAIVLGLRILMHSDWTGETGVRQATADEKYRSRVVETRRLRLVA